MKEVIKRIIVDFHNFGINEFKKRYIRIPIETNKIITLIGPRRAGKTYMLFQLMNSIKVKYNLDIKNFIYINFEDERLDFKTKDLDLIIQSYLELFPDSNLMNVYFFFDEIQEVENWEKFVRRLYDTISKNIYLTGSSAKLLSKEIATSLRGRTLSYEIFPLSFREFLDFKNINFNDIYSTKNRALLINEFQNYLNYGGFPEILSYNNIERVKILQTYLDVMIFRDLIERYKISNVEVLKLFIKKALSNISKEFSINKVYNELKSLNIKISKDKLYSFTKNVEDIFLLFFLNQYNKSLFKSENSIKKIYSIDTGLTNANSFKFFEDKGRMLENLVFIELKRRGKEIYYHKNKKECDFVIKDGLNIVEAIQVCKSLESGDLRSGSVDGSLKTKKREIDGLLDACKTYGLREGLILTDDEEGEEIREVRVESGDLRSGSGDVGSENGENGFEIREVRIRIMPIWKWLLSEE